jgi:hypothetical protein
MVIRGEWSFVRPNKPSHNNYRSPFDAASVNGIISSAKTVIAAQIAQDKVMLSENW